ncbi:tetratricopeptide repeat protein [Vibrio sp. D404a]|uniref:TPR domain-containing protein n=1 Tax=unclassified Vibrio TaxID=2614977 RepID=UPI00255531BD|nr:MULTISPECIES: tetratricopeptide repeat protein [unclassified Vibrio]MDK9740141.1 tetratricopeptide repeat protein [Vibrio sp. D404a]MDK9799292.1 tetratricopeptide repeat protein [Vibrio sp. D449a]
MENWLLISILITSLFVVSMIFMSSRSTKTRRLNLSLAVFAVLGTGVLWYLMKQDLPQPAPSESQPVTFANYQSELQSKLEQDPNQAELWFKLGSVYLEQGEFAAAVTSYDYAIRLENTPVARLFAAKATALYYANNQSMGEEVNTLLKRSLGLDPNDRTALMLIASDHFISMRYEQAIEVWTQLLDSNQQGLDRVSIIHSINQAKQML